MSMYDGRVIEHDGHEVDRTAVGQVNRQLFSALGTHTLNASSCDPQNSGPLRGSQPQHVAGADTAGVFFAGCPIGGPAFSMIPASVRYAVPESPRPVLVVAPACQFGGGVRIGRLQPSFVRASPIAASLQSSVLRAKPVIHRIRFAGTNKPWTRLADGMISDCQWQTGTGRPAIDSLTLRSEPTSTRTHLLDTAEATWALRPRREHAKAGKGIWLLPPRKESKRILT